MATNKYQKNHATLLRQHILTFQKTVLSYHRKHGRKFPWRETREPYAILVSEVMLQQTQAERVVPFFRAWMKRFPTARSLSCAPLREVLLVWQGLGYNRRALNLKRAAEVLVKEYDGKVPRDVAAIDALPGIGPYTAGAVAAFARDIPAAFVETNIRTIFLYFFFRRRENVHDEEILELVRKTMPRKVPVRKWYNALMDYGAMLKKMVGNQNARSAAYAKQSAFKGSRRELRGAILRKVGEKSVVAASDFGRASPKFSVAGILADLVAEGFLRKRGEGFILV